jgi:hypothetical protein
MCAVSVYSNRMSTLQADIAAILAQGQNPAKFRAGLAKRHGISVESVDTAIAAAGEPANISAEEAAQRRMREERQAAGTDAYRRFNHEEE